jgi:hypothetical protein
MEWSLPYVLPVSNSPGMDQSLMAALQKHHIKWPRNPWKNTENISSPFPLRDSDIDAGGSAASAGADIVKIKTSRILIP